MRKMFGASNCGQYCSILFLICFECVVVASSRRYICRASVQHADPKPTQGLSFETDTSDARHTAFTGTRRWSTKTNYAFLLMSRNYTLRLSNTLYNISTTVSPVVTMNRLRYDAQVFSTFTVLLHP